MIEGYFAADPREYLKLEFDLRHRRSSAYSLRAFARDLRMSTSSLSEFFQGKLGLSHQRVDRLSESLRLSSEQCYHWHDLIDSRFGRSPAIRKQAALRIQCRVKSHPGRVDLARFRVISDWYHFAILSAFDMNSKFQDLGVLARHLRLQKRTVTEAVNRLLQVGMLEKVEGVFKTVASSTLSGDEAPDEAIRESHRQFLQLAQRALLEQSLDRRESCSIVFALSQDKVRQCQKELRRAVVEVIGRYAAESASPETLVAMTFQMFEIFNPAGPISRQKDRQ